MKRNVKYPARRTRYQDAQEYNILFKQHEKLSLHVTRITQVWVLLWSVKFIVLSSNHVCSEGSMIIGLRIGTYFSHGFAVYLCIFGMYPSVQWFHLYYTNGPYQGLIALCRTYVDTSTQYSSYTIHARISCPMVTMHRLHLPYGSYTQAMLIPTNATCLGLPWHTMLTDDH